MFFYSRYINFIVEGGRSLRSNYITGHNCVRAEEVEDRKRVTCTVKEWEALTTYHLVLPRYRNNYVQWKSPVVNEHPEVNGKCNKVWCARDGGMRDREVSRAQFSNSADNFGNRAKATLLTTVRQPSGV